MKAMWPCATLIAFLTMNSLGCGGDDGTAESKHVPSGAKTLCAQLADKFGGCAQQDFTPAEIGCGVADDEHGEVAKCELGCFLEATCSDLQDLVCDGEDSEFDACFDACQPPPFACATGGKAIPASWECDGMEDCEDGSDEHARCPVFACASGDETIPADWECDGWTDCEDDSDEHARCPVFACASGDETIPADWKCDGWKDCEDASDEAGCRWYEDWCS